MTVANNLALAGLVLLAISMCGAIALISDYLLGAATALVSTATVAVEFAGFWYLGPILRRRNPPPR